MAKLHIALNSHIESLPNHPPSSAIADVETRLQRMTQSMSSLEQNTAFKLSTMASVQASSSSSAQISFESIKSALDRDISDLRVWDMN